MSQRALPLPEISLFPPPNTPKRLAESAPQFPSPRECFEFEAMPESVACDGNCLKGAGFALVFEVLAALFVYGGWLMWKALR